MEVVRAVLLTRTITGAADMLNVSPAAVSRMLRHTESQIGFELFSRGRHGFTPTPEAADLLDDLEEVHARIKRVQDRLQQSELAGRSLRIGASSGLGLSLVPRAVARTKALDPAFEFELDVLHIDEIVPHLELGACDFALTIFDVDDPRVGCRKLAVGELVCLVPDDHVLSACEHVSLTEIAKHNLVGFDRRSFQQRMIDRLFAAQSLQPHYGSRARLMVTACALVREGLGITLIDEFTVFGNPLPGTKIIRIENGPHFPLNLVTNPKAPLSQKALSFLAVLRRMLKDGMRG